MRKLCLAGILMLVIPVTASAQTMGVGVRVGTLGLGGEVSVRVIDMVGVRAGLGFIPIEYNGTFSDMEYTIEPTSPLANVGVDFYPFGGGFRIGAGLLFTPEDTRLEARHTGEFEIGDNTYSGSEVGTLIGELDHGTMAPYVVIGFGRTMRRGVGLFLDLGAAFLEEPALTFTATGEAANHPQFQEDLEKHRQSAEEATSSYLRILPILSIGLRVGLF
jgi:hypothetical protein